jgi:hypothetical protein
VAAKKTKAPAKKRKKSKNKKKGKRETEESVKEFLSSVPSHPEYVKHLIECRCSLPQFRNWTEPPNHQFVVFSILNEQADVLPSYAQCNNCGIIHRVTEVNKSTTIKKEEMRSLTTVSDIESQLPEWLAGALEKHECDLHVWQEAKFIYENGLWGRAIVLSKDREDDLVIIKICQILGKKLYKIESFERDEGWIE